MRIFQQRLSHDQADESQRHNVPVVTLSFADRRRSRQRLKLNTGEEVGLALEHGLVLVDGDWLADANGELIMVRAARETVLRITSGSNLQLTRAAYHLGNRHVTLEVGDGYLQLEHDPVLVDMLTQLGGLTLDQVQAAFNPDVGAYGGGHRHGHDESFDEDYALAQAAFTANEPESSHGHPHHDHTHDHGHGEHGPHHD